LLVAAAVVARLVATAVLVFTDAVDHNGWYFPNDDQTQYYSFADALTRGELAPVYPTIGGGLVLVPFAAATSFVLQAIPAVAAVQIALGLLAGIVLYRIGVVSVGRRGGAVAAALWLALPLVVGPFFERPVFDFWRGTAPVWLGINIGADYISALLAVAVMALTLRARAAASVAGGFALGAVGGFAVLTKPPNAILLGTALLALVVWRTWRPALGALATAAVVFAPQFVLNARYFGSIADFAYSPEVAARLPGNLEVLTGGSFAAENVSRTYRTLADGLLGGPALLVVVAIALAVTAWRFPVARWLAVPTVVGYGIVIGSYYYADGGHFARLVVPALPALCLAVGGLAGGRAPEAPATTPVTGRAVPALAAAVVAAAVAASVWIAVAPAAGTATTIAATPVVDGLRAEARVDGGEVMLSWKRQRAPATLVYQALRLRDPEPRTPTIRGFQWGGLEVVERVDADGTTSRDRPGPGVWWYRVVVNPSPVEGGEPPYDVAVAVSPPVRVVVG
jgi:hypothetical protein